MGIDYKTSNSTIMAIMVDKKRTLLNEWVREAQEFNNNYNKMKKGIQIYFTMPKGINVEIKIQNKRGD